MNNTSWQKSAKWYNKTVGNEGHYYHHQVVIPNSLVLLDLKKGDNLVDFACGQGVLERKIPNGIGYLGIDIAPDLIKEAEFQKKDKSHIFKIADVTKKLNERKLFNKACILLALQNLRRPEMLMSNAAQVLKKGGELIIVINHPVFRIPRFSAWGIDESRKIQYRRIDRYLTPIEIPITMHPGQSNSEETWTFHFSLSELSSMLNHAGFLIEKIEEWVSDKKSYGGAAKMENRARDEFPMFMAIKAILSRD